MDNKPRQPTEKIQLSGEKETLLITLYAKAQESRLDDSLLHDDLALQAVERIGYDVSRLKVNRDMFIGLALRAHLFDSWTRTFLSRYESPCVLRTWAAALVRGFIALARLKPSPGSTSIFPRWSRCAKSCIPREAATR